MTGYQRDLFGARVGEYPIPTNGQHAFCGSCGAEMIWTYTSKRRPIPLSLATVEVDEEGRRTAMPHFVDCPQAKEWSK